MKVRNRRDSEPFVTLDGSTIREIIHPSNTSGAKQSIAEATLAPGHTTRKHVHKRSEEIYYILRGEGRMHLEGEEFSVRVNDAVRIPAGAEHYIENTGRVDVIFLCCSTPPYSDEDTEML